MIVWITDSRVLAIGERRAMGRYDVCRLGSLLGLRIGRIFAVFHLLGMIFWFIILLKRLVILVMV